MFLEYAGQPSPCTTPADAVLLYPIYFNCKNIFPQKDALKY